ncbi:hypothetical protein BaRGS_00027259 [Batillaria attramentaria]|uniref:Uncharacterized protein n=1 Tax=Batillaria attramentaria TaxID=370345 RepID=A0ABD0K315_9CAEN
MIYDQKKAAMAVFVKLAINWSVKNAGYYGNRNFHGYCDKGHYYMDADGVELCGALTCVTRPEKGGRVAGSAASVRGARGRHAKGGGGSTDGLSEDCKPFTVCFKCGSSVGSEAPWSSDLFCVLTFTREGSPRQA